MLCLVKVVLFIHDNHSHPLVGLRIALELFSLTSLMAMNSSQLMLGLGEDNFSWVPYWFLTSTRLLPFGDVYYKPLPLLLCSPPWGTFGKNCDAGDSGLWIFLGLGKGVDDRLIIHLDLCLSGVLSMVMVLRIVLADVVIVLSVLLLSVWCYVPVVVGTIVVVSGCCWCVWNDHCVANGLDSHRKSHKCIRRKCRNADHVVHVSVC